jgi:TetR/AcrR family fatty acid metabolism transcriptional regulator
MPAAVSHALRPRRPSRGRPPTPGLRDAILRTAEPIFTRLEYHEVQMDDVARECGVGKGTLYRYFRDKRDLYFAVTFAGVERLRTEIETHLRADDAPERKIEHVVRHTLTRFWDRRHFFALIQQHEHQAGADVRAWFQHRARLVRLVQGALDDAIRRGQLRRVDSRIATELLFGMIRAANRYRAREDSLDRLVAMVVDVFMRGVGAPRGERRPTARRRKEG